MLMIEVTGYELSLRGAPPPQQPFAPMKSGQKTIEKLA